MPSLESKASLYRELAAKMNVFCYPKQGFSVFLLKEHWTRSTTNACFISNKITWVIQSYKVLNGMPLTRERQFSTKSC